MIERNLSDHVGDQRREADQALAELGDAYYRRQVEGQRALDRWEAARASKSWWKRVRGVETPEEAAAWGGTRAALADLDEAKSAFETGKINQQKLVTGEQGERVLLDHLSDRPHQWVVFNGYRNRRGEIDHLVLGPMGLWAVEVKNRRVLLEVSGQEWVANKLDTAGKVVGEEPAADQGGQGRNWGRQVAEPAELLADHLADKGQVIPVRTAVLLVKPGAKVGRSTDPGIDLVTADLFELDRAIKMLSHPLDEAEVAALAELIESHHHYHAARRSA
ncbi:MAG: nuclease-related domain-containing protein [Actinomycetota bacterium]